MPFAAILAPTDSAAALAHVTAARQAARPDSANRPPAVETALVVGAGTMGAGIAMALADAGIAVALTDAAPQGLEQAMGRIAADYHRAVGRGRLTTAEAEARRGRIRPVASADGPPGPVDLVVEAVFEDLGLKQRVLADLCPWVAAEGILATNTSTLDINRLAAAVPRPDRVIGSHFFVPAQVTPLLEVVPGAATAPAVLARVLALAERLGKVAVEAGICDGFIGNRMFDQYLRQAMFLVEAGALPWEVDAALEGWGMAIGPFRSLDLIGNEVPWAARRRRAEERAAAGLPPRVEPVIGDRLCARGWSGRKTGEGWYLYTSGAPVPNPAAEALILQTAQALGVNRRPVAPAEIVARCVLALAVEGSRLLTEGIGRRAGDVDLVSVTGYGFPAARGGPLFLARALGAETCAALYAACALGHGDAGFWSSAPLPGVVTA